MKRDIAYPKHLLNYILTYSTSNVGTKAALLASRLYKSSTYLSPLQRTSSPVPNRLFYRTISTIPSNPLLSTQYTGLSGRTYTIEHVLQEEVSPPRQVYRASLVDTNPSLYLHTCLYI